MTVCDITQFWSPSGGGVRRYVGEKIRNLREHVPGGRHVLIIPGERDEVTGDDTARVYTIASPAISRITGYRVLLRLREISRILAAECVDDDTQLTDVIASETSASPPHGHFTT